MFPVEGELFELFETPVLFADICCLVSSRSCVADRVIEATDSFTIGCLKCVFIPTELLTFMLVLLFCDNKREIIFLTLLSLFIIGRSASWSTCDGLSLKLLLLLLIGTVDREEDEEEDEEEEADDDEFELMDEESDS